MSTVNTMESIIAVSITIFAIVLNMYIISPRKFHIIEFFGLMFVTDIFSIVCIVLLKFSEYSIGIIVTLIEILYTYYKTKSTIVVLVNATFPLGIVLICNYLTINVLYIFGINTYEWVNNFIRYAIFSFILMTFSLILSYLLNYMLNKNLKVREIELKLDQTFLMATFSVIFYIMIYFNIFFGKDYYESPVLRITSFCLLLAEFLFSTYTMFYFLKSIRMEEENKRKQDMLNQAEVYTKEIENLYFSMKEFKHDYNNMMLTMSCLIEDEDIEGIKDYFYTKIYPYSHDKFISSLRIDSLIRIKVSQVKSLIASKIALAQGVDPPINFEVEVSSNITNIDMDMIDLGRAIGIILDNAIEAARECKNSYIKVVLSKSPRGIIITTRNNFLGEIPNIYELYERGVSTKGASRGLGLSNLKEIAVKYDNVTVDISRLENEFCLTLNVDFINREPIKIENT